MSIYDMQRICTLLINMMPNKNLKNIKDFYEKYELGEKIGEGAFAEVYKCYNKKTRAQYACKQAKIKKEIIKYIETEIKLNTSLKEKSAQNVIYAEEIYKTPDSIYYIMPFCNSGTLEEWIEHGTSVSVLPEDEAQYFIKKIVTGLNWIHKQNFIHRDIKPANIMLNKISDNKVPHYENYEVYLCDFGLAKQGGVAETVLGTPITMAPEISKKGKDKYDAKADIWSLGIILYFLCIASYPYNDYGKLKTLDVQKISIPAKRGLSLACLSFMELCLQYEKTSRPTTAELMNHIFFTQEVPFYLKSGLMDLRSKEYIILDHKKKDLTNKMNEREGKQKEMQMYELK